MCSVGPVLTEISSAVGAWHVNRLATVSPSGTPTGTRSMPGWVSSLSLTTGPFDPPVVEQNYALAVVAKNPAARPHVVTIVRASHSDYFINHVFRWAPRPTRATFASTRCLYYLW